jgi:hypothetical protein
VPFKLLCSVILSGGIRKIAECIRNSADNGGFKGIGYWSNHQKNQKNSID